MKIFQILTFLILSTVAKAESWPIRDIVGLESRGNYVTLITRSGSVTIPSASLVIDPLGRDLTYAGPTGQRAISIPADSVLAGPNITLEAEWKCADGSTQRVLTPCFSFNRPQDCVAAHTEMVRLMKEAFPPKSPQ